ncbi:hypothetical protein, partial [Methylobacterium sp.]|uniref:hypothetical protein n=1 Tax=Methylobacterium sp. TaxID=409 RepID=UPI00261AC165
MSTFSDSVRHGPAQTAPGLAAFRDDSPRLSPLRSAIVAAGRRSEVDCLASLLDRAALPPEAAARVAVTARHLVETLRRTASRGGVEGLIHE